MQKRRESAWRSEIKQEKTEKIEGDLATQRDEKQVVTLRSSQEERTIISNSKVSKLKIVRSNIIKRSVTGVIQQNIGSYKKIQRQHCQIIAINLTNERSYHQEHRPSS